MDKKNEVRFDRGLAPRRTNDELACLKVK